ncbi:MAG: hypothetical protein NZ898_00685 [Myxococcota bacterium]|nr:hypothetical protein [Myxococcota bacterium]MDW8362703.1 hypothetical protein [Myxococcales bacterium]
MDDRDTPGSSTEPSAGVGVAIPSTGGEPASPPRDEERRRGDARQERAAVRERGSEERRRGAEPGATTEARASTDERATQAAQPAANPIRERDPSGGTSGPGAGGGTSSTSMDGLDSVLDRALGGRPVAGGTRTEPLATPATAAQPTGELPATPDPATVRRLLAGALPALRQCAGDQVGMANAAIIVRNDGTVASVSIAGAPFGGTPQGACMEGILQRLQFPRFQQSTFQIRYPFVIRPQT